MSARRRVLLVGQGGREHALALRLLESPSVAEVFLAPGNAGTDANSPQPVEGKRLANAQGAPVDVARALRPDLVVVGPENPLCAGLVDELEAAGCLVYGPRRAAARLEGSKAFLKDFAVRHGINTPRHQTVRSEADLARAMAEFEQPPVVKADGLCAGKGVVVASTLDEAWAAAREMLSGRAFGDAGRCVVLEERLYGSELSVHAICDGERALILPFVQDHKRLGDGDRGPNTGGMGTYGPVPLPEPWLAEHIRREIIERVVSGMAESGVPFRGTLFANLMLVPGGKPALFEINVRFGDPETQVLMNLLEGDLCELLSSAARGGLPSGSAAAACSQAHALCVILAATGYPQDPRRGDVISGLERASAFEGVRVYHAGTARANGAVVTAGGRVLGVTGVGGTLIEAHSRAYRAADGIEFAGKQLRRDIGAQTLGGGLAQALKGTAAAPPAHSRRS